MPKIIEGLAEKLAAEARRQCMESGYGAMTIRSVAEALGVSPGVVYNYYPSKEDLAAAFILADWKETLAAMEPKPGDTPKTALRTVHRELLAFLSCTAAFSGTLRSAALRPSPPNITPCFGLSWPPPSAGFVLMRSPPNLLPRPCWPGP